MYHAGHEEHEGVAKVMADEVDRPLLITFWLLINRAHKADFNQRVC
ncbi:MAG: hypothetical protein U0892_12675 [Pirellulales bacterium]